MTDHHDNFDDIEALFREARDARPVVSERLTSAILADAAAQQAHWQAPPLPPQDGSVRRGPLAALVSALGGWVSVGGLVTASCTGLWIGLWVGIAGPEVVMNAAGLGTLSDASAMVSGDDYAAYETFDLATVLAEDMQ
ncbi:hypothetical protein [Phaeobacter sp. B1627]|uniref:hypothetical protein n=1 Tax=Phaeobacter sp. B1627 TaxID=2583809 RepID=UPI0011188760|nr:hypothetical protein [Phaeobacter sp. B1627]TNJ41828.1 hypothetical protein FGE21_13145 [Phaeobacter sp. B1627]